MSRAHGAWDGCHRRPVPLPAYAVCVSARQRLLIVSNRLPLTAKRVSGRWRGERSSGGLVAAIWAVAGPALTDLFQSAISSVSGE